MGEDHAPARASAAQPSLFAIETTPIAAAAAPLIEIALPTGDSTLGACALPYQDYLRRTDHSPYTITCFLSDLRMLTDFLGRNTPARDLSQDRLGSWLEHLRHGRETRPAPKTMARRVTFLKNFFGWLQSVGALERNALAKAGHVLARVAEPEVSVVHERQRVLPLEPLEHADGPRAAGRDPRSEMRQCTSGAWKPERRQ